MMLASVLAIVCSAVLIAILGRHDPKRLRSGSRGKSSATRRATLHPGTRRLLSWLTLAPGVVLLAMSQWWAFLIWLGAVCALGWLTTQVLDVSGSRNSSLSSRAGTARD